MQNFAFDLYSSLSQVADVKLISWGGSNKFLPLVLPYFFIRACFVLVHGGIDVIHSQDAIVSCITWPLSKLFGRPYTVVLHGLDITHPNRLYQSVIPWFVSRADTVFCISKAAMEAAVVRGVPRDKMKVIPLGITDQMHDSKIKARTRLTKIYNLGSRSKIMLTTGRLVKRKGVAWFIQNVLPDLVEKQPEIIYLVAGDGEDKENITSVVKTTGMEPHVRLLGRVEDKMMPILYNGADLFVMPNIPVAGDIEGFGRVLLEASLCELPVVASGIEGIKDAIKDGKNGSLIKPRDTKAYSETISKILSDKRAAAKFGKNSRKYTLDTYDWKIIVRSYLAAINLIKKSETGKER